MIDKVLTPNVIAMLNEERNHRKSVELIKKANSERNVQDWLETEFPIESILKNLRAGTADCLQQKIAAGWIESKLEKPRRGPRGKAAPWSFSADLFWASHATDHILRFWKQRGVRLKLADAIEAACKWTLGPSASETAITNLAAQVRIDRKRPKARSFRHN